MTTASSVRTARATLSGALVSACLGLGVLSMAGCASEGPSRPSDAGAIERITAAQDRQNTQLGAQDSRMSAYDAALASQNEKLNALDRTTRDALARLGAAEKPAAVYPAGATFVETEVARYEIGFGVGSALTPDAQAKLTEFAAKLKTDNRPVFLEIQGHTDATGPASANFRLGAERAEAVRLFLNKQGVPLNRMSVISYGADTPKASNATPAGRIQNRRVVILVLT